MSPIVADKVTVQDKRLRFIFFVAWTGLVLWLVSGHVFWRDEVRAFSLALAGSNLAEMLKALHGEGHPAIWYLLLRTAHEIVSVREVLPVVAALVGIATGAIIAFRAPFRIGVIFLILFSYFSAFEYSVIARNYGIAAFVMVALAALYPRVRDSLWFGLMVALLANTNVPAAILAGSFMLFRFVELLTERPKAGRRQWLVFVGNGLLALVGAYLCFRTIYPTFNNQAVSANLADLNLTTIMTALVDGETGFHRIYPGRVPYVLLIVLLLSCLAFVRKPAALAASPFAFAGLKFFFFFIYGSSYRHEALFLIFILALFWITARDGGGHWRLGRWADYLVCFCTWIFLTLLTLQTVMLVRPIASNVWGVPYSRASELADLLEERGLSSAIIMADPDPIAETLPYYADNPLWFLREQKFGKVVRLTNAGRKDLTLDDVLADASMLHRKTGRPVVFLAPFKLAQVSETRVAMYDSTTTLTAESVRHFEASTRLLASLRPAFTDEQYEVYVYPR